MQIRVYYEDTDSGGVVYYANYLCYCERARTEFFRDRGIEVAAYDKAGFLFVVAHVDASFRSPARHNDLLEVKSNIIVSRKVGFTFLQQIYKEETGDLIFEAKIKLACINSDHRPTSVPDKVKQIVSRSIEEAKKIGLV